MYEKRRIRYYVNKKKTLVLNSFIFITFIGQVGKCYAEEETNARFQHHDACKHGMSSVVVPGLAIVRSCLLLFGIRTAEVVCLVAIANLKRRHALCRS